MSKLPLKEEVIKLRKEGRTYSEIRKTLGIKIPKSTLSYWCKNIRLPEQYERKIQEVMKEGRKKGLAIALIVNKIKRERVLREIRDRIKNLPLKLKDKEVAKIALAMLYLGEGTKNTKGSLVFANSDAEVIQLFLKLLRYS